MDLYPSTRYRDGKDGIESKRVENPEHEALVCPESDGWRHHPNPDQPPSMSHDEVRALAYQALNVAQFPSMRYRVHPETGAPESRRVESAEEAAALGEGWSDEASVLATATPLRIPNSVGRFGDDTPPFPDLGVSLTPEAEAEAEALLHATPNKQIIGGLLQIEDIDQLARVEAREQRNPKGPRKMVLSAIQARVAELAEREKDAAKVSA